MKTIITSAVITIYSLSISTVSFSQNPDKQFVQLTSINENHQLLATLNGTWTFKGKHIFPDTTRKPFEFSGAITRKSIMSGRYFVTETKSNGKLKMPWANGALLTYSDMTLEGYDNVSKKFVASNIGNETNTGIINYEGTYDASTKTITYLAASTTHLHPDLPPGALIQFRELVRIIDDNHYILEHYEILNGKQIVLTELSYTRVSTD